MSSLLYLSKERGGYGYFTSYKFLYWTWFVLGTSNHIKNSLPNIKVFFFRDHDKIRQAGLEDWELGIYFLVLPQCTMGYIISAPWAWEQCTEMCVYVVHQIGKKAWGFWPWLCHTFATTPSTTHYTSMNHSFFTWKIRGQNYTLLRSLSVLKL